MFCPKCGNELPDGGKFCAYCGKVVSEELQPPQEKKPSEANQSSKNTFQYSYSVGDNAQQQKSIVMPKKKKIVEIVSIAGLVLIAIIVVGGIVRTMWLKANFPYYSSSGHNTDSYVGTVTSTLPLGNTFGQKDFTFIPIEVSYVTNEVGYSDNGEPYVTITLDITCLFSKWRPKSDDIKFMLNGNYAVNHKYTDKEIKRGETARYTFTHPILSSSTTDVSMQLTVKCVTGTTVNLYFPVDNVSELFNHREPVVGTEGEYDDITGTYIDDYGDGFYLFIGYEDSSKQTAYLEVELVTEMVLVELIDRNGNSISGHNLHFYPQATSPTQIVDLDYNPYDGSITATIYAVTQDCTIRFVPYPNAPYQNPFYVG